VRQRGRISGGEHGRGDVPGVDEVTNRVQGAEPHLCVTGQGPAQLRGHPAGQAGLRCPGADGVEHPQHHGIDPGHPAQLH
jgi:hypothetical protein